MLAHLAAEKMQADRSGSLLSVNESIAPTSDGPAGHVPWPTDLGGIDHLFRDPADAIFHAVSVPLEQATTSLRGPNGGLVPGYLQHLSTVAKADGAQLVHGSLAGTTATPGTSAISDLVLKVRTWLGL